MLFDRRVPNKVMADWCRALGTPLRAGLSLKDAVRLSSKKTSGAVGDLSSRLAAQLEAGQDLPSALEAMGDNFPPLFTAMAHAASATGHFPETLKELERFFGFQVQLRRQFIQQIFWPALQLVMAIFAVAMMIFLIGMLAPTSGFDPLGLGLLGPSGAAIWLAGCFGAIFLVFVAYLTLRKLGQAAWMDAVLLRVPAYGPAMQALAMSRLCYGLRMVLDSTLSLRKGLPMALSATDNAAYVAIGKVMVKAVHKQGDTLHEAFGKHPSLFPEEFLAVLESAEASGVVPEEMGRLAVHYNEVTEARLRLLNTVAAQVIWGLVAAMIVFIIFRIALSYIGMLNEFTTDPMGTKKLRR